MGIFDKILLRETERKGTNTAYVRWMEEHGCDVTRSGYVVLTHTVNNPSWFIRVFAKLLDWLA